MLNFLNYYAFFQFLTVDGKVAKVGAATRSARGLAVCAERCIFAILYTYKDMDAEKKLFLIDAYAIIYRAYYALIRTPRMTADGRNTSAVFGFCNALHDILRKENPPYMAVCFDPRGKTFRHEEYPEYKAQRDKQPEDISFAVPYIKRIVEAYGIQVLEVERYEADDVIGTLSVEATRQGFTTYMMTPDKDYGQLVNDHVYMYRPAIKGQGFEIRGPKEVCERYGIENTGQVVDLLALEGDAADNIPGCPGVGEKTAAKLIRQFGNVENMLANTGEINGKLGERIAENADQIRFSRHLVTIKTDVPLSTGPEDLKRGEADTAELRKLFNELEFRSFLKTLGDKAETVEAEAPVVAAKNDDGMSSLFDEPVDEPVAATRPAAAVQWQAVRTAGQVEAMCLRCADADEVAIALNVSGDEAMTATLSGMAVSAGEGRNYYIDNPETVKALAALFNGKATVISNDMKRDLLILRRMGADIAARLFDTSVAHYMLKPESKHKLSDMALTYLGERLPDYEMSDAELRKPVTGSEKHVGDTLCARADAVRRLRPVLDETVAADGTSRLLHEVELPLIRVLADMEWQGVRIDRKVLAEMSAEMTARMNSIERDCYELAGSTFNLSSPMQVGEILFGRLKIDPKAKRTKKGAFSTTEEILEKHRHSHRLVDLILQYRGLKKLLSTYIDALPKLVNPATGKIHTTYNQTVTATGRISSTNPNLQNIPIRTDAGREIRRAFIADDGCLLMSADYSQIELRLMAVLSQDTAMIDAFAHGSDIHRATAAKIYHTAEADVTDSQRRNAKTANFGIIYGISAFGLSERLGIPRSEAKALIEGYLATYPGVDAYMKHAIDTARGQQYVTTLMGRKRYLPEINSRNAVVRGYAERNAINAPLQGSAADIIKVAMVNIDRAISAEGLRSKMLMQVHDELIFNVFPDEAERLEAIVVDNMQKAMPTLPDDMRAVSLTVSAGIGQNWLEAH